MTKWADLCIYLISMSGHRNYSTVFNGEVYSCYSAYLANVKSQPTEILNISFPSKYLSMGVKKGCLSRQKSLNIALNQTSYSVSFSGSCRRWWRNLMTIKLLFMVPTIYLNIDHCDPNVAKMEFTCTICTSVSITYDINTLISICCTLYNYFRCRGCGWGCEVY